MKEESKIISLKRVIRLDYRNHTFKNAPVIYLWGGNKLWLLYHHGFHMINTMPKMLDLNALTPFFYFFTIHASRKT